MNFQDFSEAPTRFELVIEVLQTFALPLGYGAISILFCLKKCYTILYYHIFKNMQVKNDSKGN